MDRIFTEADREKQAAVARKHRIWEQSTGPKSKEGKERSRMNAVKHGMRSEAAKRVKVILTQQSQFLQVLNDTNQPSTPQ